MKRCDDIRAGLDDWLDGLLEDRVRRDIESHLAECDACEAFFKQQEEMAGDLMSLAHAANRIAEESPAGAQPSCPHRTRWPAIGIAAAILIMVGIGLYSSRYSGPPSETGGFAEAPQGDSIEAEKKTHFDLTIPENCLARHVESDNPRVHIVWFVPETLPPESTPAEETHDSIATPTHES